MLKAGQAHHNCAVVSATKLIDGIRHYHNSANVASNLRDDNHLNYISKKINEHKRVLIIETIYIYILAKYWKNVKPKMTKKITFPVIYKLFIIA